MAEIDNEGLPNVFIEQRDKALPDVYVIFRGALDKFVWVDVVEGELRLMTQARLLSPRLHVYEESRDAAARGALAEAFQAANALVDQINPFVQPIMEFVRKIHEANPDPYSEGSQPVIDPVQIQGWLAGPVGPHVDIYIANMGIRSGWISIDDRPRQENEFIFDAGLNLFLLARDYVADMARIVADARPVLDSAGTFARSMERYMPRPEDA